MRLLEGHALLRRLARRQGGSVCRLPLSRLLLRLLRHLLLVLLRLSQGLSSHLLLNLLLRHRRLLMLHPLRLHPNIHCQLLQSLLQGGNIIICIERGSSAIERLLQAFGHLGELV